MLVSERARPPGSCANTVWVIQRSLDVAHQWTGPEQTCSVFIWCEYQVRNWPVHSLTTWCVWQPFTRLSVKAATDPSILNRPPCARQAEQHEEAAGWIATKCQSELLRWVKCGFNILWSVIWPDSCVVLMECFVAAIFHNPCVKSPCITSKCVSPHHSFSVSLFVSMFDSSSAAACCP